MPQSTLLTDEDRNLLAKVSNLLEELTETISILEDKKSHGRPKTSKKRGKRGKTQRLQRLLY